MYLLLFDIDGTLIDSGEAGTRSLNLAFKELFSIENAFYEISMAGKTDIQIIKEGLRKYGIPINKNTDSVIGTYLKHLKIEINNDSKHIKPGIYELLEILKLVNNIKLGLLTGNLEHGARIKLQPFRLNGYFPTGAFGSDDEDRDRLLPIAIKRFEKIYQKEIAVSKCIVIGDTPKDVNCAKINGALCVGVATGPYSISDLIEAGADIVFNDLTDHKKFFEFLNLQRKIDPL
ncbi:MAG: HAD hydrolase-like protein [Nitrospirae bacterium]|nr:HAD hydrolase-like protein [Nitrospirota bacterium]